MSLKNIYFKIPKLRYKSRKFKIDNAVAKTKTSLKAMVISAAHKVKAVHAPIVAPVVKLIKPNVKRRTCFSVYHLIVIPFVSYHDTVC